MALVTGFFIVDFVLGIISWYFVLVASIVVIIPFYFKWLPEVAISNGYVMLWVVVIVWPPCLVGYCVGFCVRSVNVKYKI